MSRILEVQQYLADLLNECEALVQGGCRAFAEDEHETVKAIPAWVAAGRTAIVVTTPEFRRDGCEPGKLPMDAAVRVVCEEKPALLRAQGKESHLTALDAAEEAAHALDGPTWNVAAIRQSFDAREGILSATVEINVHVKL